ncbi:siphovirus ReqiPepy6 Gp37-like family protein [Bacillus sp. B-jedd]|uniref:siphovirus ReqiPepy6 Gp37-like family protein n=1 Tax=Bacillus sp. B-jedd TaxID=1476857 RepID=UPI0005155B74|nr:siphovirus ReqiPepy6 Gp37-like family protein [Bacillus sp. B-jedd]CEG28071.1 phage minor structural protein, N-region [Bacillus sp. B-jedd]
MKSIRIINPNFELLAEIDDYESLMFTRSWHGIGQLELKINRYKKHTEHLTRGNIIRIGPKKAFIIRHREIGLDEKGRITENWVIKGLALKSITGQRITLPPLHTAYDNRQSNAETVMKHYVKNNLTNAIDTSRNYSDLMIAQNLNRGPSVSWQSRFKNLAEELADISMVSGLGWDINLDFHAKKWILDCSAGRNLTAGQDFLPPVIFSPQFDAIKELQYSDSDLDYKNIAYVAGQGEGVDRRVIILGNAKGLARHEVFIDARDVEEVDENENPIPESQIVQALTDRGYQKMQEFLQEEYLEGQILTHSPFKYEVDYDLGDIVTVQNKSWGVTLDARITEIQEIYERSGFKLEAVFGQSRPTLIKKIKQELAQVGGEVRK